MNVRIALFPLLCLIACSVSLVFQPSLMAVDATAEIAGDRELAAAGHAHHGPPTSPLLNVDVGSAIWNLMIFVVVFFVLAMFVWPPILRGLQARESRIHNDLVDAEEARKEAVMLRSDLQAQLDQAQAKIQAMLNEARGDAEVSGQRIVEMAKEEAERSRQRAIAEIESAKKVALAEMADQTTSIAMSLAKQVVGRELKSEDHADLIRQSLDHLPSAN